LSIGSSVVAEEREQLKFKDFKTGFNQSYDFKNLK